jgi:hypothetical protein
MPISLPGYYNRFAESDRYESLLFRASKGLQSAELNEVQDIYSTRLRRIADVLFPEGTVVRGTPPVINATTGAVVCPESTIYIAGAMRTVAARSFTIPVVGIVQIGVHLASTVVTEDDDIDLVDPATGTRNYGEPGAGRLRQIAAWCHDGEGLEPFYPVYTVVNGVINGDGGGGSPFVDLLARYDREANGSYVVSGLNVTAIDAAGAFQVSSGVGNVWGYKLDRFSDERITFAADPQLETVTSEPEAYVNSSTAITLNKTPVQAITEVVSTRQVTESVTRGGSAGGSDTLPDPSIVSVISVTQGGTTYTSPADYVLTGDAINWTPGGAEPSPGSTYSVVYRYLSTFAPTDVDLDAGTFKITGAVTGQLVLTDYTWRLPRVDRICLDGRNQIVRLRGQASRYQPVPPSVPGTLLLLATVFHRWSYSAPPAVKNDGTRVVDMRQQQNIRELVVDLFDLISRERLEREVGSREPTTKRSVLVDPCIDDVMRDGGINQDALMGEGGLQLPVITFPMQLQQGNNQNSMLPYVEEVVIGQSLQTGTTLINPYGAVPTGDPDVETVGATISLTPSVDHTVATTRYEWIKINANGHDPHGKFDAATFDEVRALAIAAGTILSLERDVKRREFEVSYRGADGEIIRRKRETLEIAIPDRSQVHFARTINVQFSIAGFKPGETLTELTFDGVDVTPVSPLVANGTGNMSGSFTIPAQVPVGIKVVAASGDENSYTETQFAATVALTGTPQRDGKYKDPVAQTFRLDHGRWITSVDIAFRARGNAANPVRVQIRETIAGFPGSTVIAEAVTPGSFATTGWTNVPLVVPVWLDAGNEYAITLLTDDNLHAVGLAALGGVDSTTGLQVTEQASPGVLLKSANASTWTAFQLEDLTFRLKAAQFTATTRTVDYGYIHSLQPSSMTFAGGLATVTAVGHGFDTGEAIVCSGAAQGEYNGIATVTRVDDDTFTFPVTGSPATPATGTIFISRGRVSDLQVMGRVVQPTLQCGVVFNLTVDGGTAQPFAHLEHVQLDSRIQAGARLSVTLTGTTTESPFIGRDLAVLFGELLETGTYITRATPVAEDDRVELNFDALIPNSAGVAVALQAGAPGSPSWETVPFNEITQDLGDGWGDYNHRRATFDTAGTETRARFTLTGTPASRPLIRNIRMAILEI